MLQDKKNELTSQLHATGCVKFGQFTLKTGESSSYYIDLRESTLHYKLFQLIVDAIVQVILKQKLLIEQIAIVGVPYGVVPVAAVVAYELKAAYYPVRKEVKSYGNKTDSSLLPDHKYILIEDVMSSGSSIIETIKKMEGKNVTDVIVIVDREANGVENIKAVYPNIRLHSILKTSEIFKQHTNYDDQ